jgi:hypothetical protein
MMLIMTVQSCCNTYRVFDKYDVCLCGVLCVHDPAQCEFAYVKGLLSCWLHTWRSWLLACESASYMAAAAAAAAVVAVASAAGLAASCFKH